jgi:hypothetical protein
VTVAWVPFRAPDLATTFAVWRGMFGIDGIAVPSFSPILVSLAMKFHLAVEIVGFRRTDVALILAALGACLLFPNSQQILARGRIGLDSPGYSALAVGAPGALTWRPTAAWAIAIGVVLGFGFRTIGGYSQFIYFHFYSCDVAGRYAPYPIPGRLDLRVCFNMGYGFDAMRPAITHEIMSWILRASV